MAAQAEMRSQRAGVALEAEARTLQQTTAQSVAQSEALEQLRRLPSDKGHLAAEAEAVAAQGDTCYGEILWIPLSRNL